MKHWLKFVIGWVAVFAIQFLPFRPPNVEPVLAAQMPFAKRFGWFGGFFFGFTSIALYDLLAGRVGVWTWVTAGMFGLLGILAFLFFKKRKAEPKNFLVCAVFGTLLYDAVTGLTIGPLFFGQSFMGALVGQIPFTLYHLVGNVVFSLVVSPLAYRWIVENESLETDAILEKIALGYSGR